MKSALSTWKPFIGLFIILGFLLLIVFELWGFIDGFLGSIVLYILLRSSMQFMIKKRKWKKGWAALLLIFTSFLIIIVPIFTFSYLFISKLTVIFSESSFVVQTLDTINSRLQHYTGFELLSDENIVAVRDKAAVYIAGFFGASLNILANVGVMYFVLYFLLINTGDLEKWFDKNLPISEGNMQLLSDDLKAQTFSNAIGTPLLALVQGVFAWIGYWVFGLSDPFFWGMMTGFFSFLPIVGTAIIWLPAGLYQMTVGTTWQGIGILIYGLIVIGSVDNVFRFLFQKKFANVHPLITVFGVLLGLKMFGIPGIIFGPVLLSWFFIILKIYQEDFLPAENKKR